MAIVRDFYIGKTHVKIDDTYCKDKTKEEVQEILDRIAARALRAINAAHFKKLQEEKLLNETTAETQESEAAYEGAEDISE